MIYWDNNATTPLTDCVLEAMMPYLTQNYFNPSASYAGARQVRAAIEKAREQVAELIGAHPDEIIFTSGGTEATNTALAQMKNCVGCSTDHPASLESPYITQLAPVDHTGLIPIDEWSRLLPNHTGASFCWANSETGAVQDVKELTTAAVHAGIPVHVDAVSALGKLAIRVHDYPIDYLSIASHKIHGPKGVGALYIRRGAPYSPLIHGASHEMSRRAGTENVAGIVGFGQATVATLGAQVKYKELSLLRDDFEQLMMDSGLNPVIHSLNAPRLCNVSSMRLPGYRAESLFLLLEAAGLICAAGSACSTANPKPSHVLTAMGISDQEARETLRFSLSRETTKEEVKEAADILIRAVEKITSVQSSQTGPVTVYKA